MGNLPNFIYIGPDKAGSTWLYRTLSWHRAVFTPQVKELFYFDRYHARGLDWYASHYDGVRPEQSVVADISHDYLFDPTVPGRIRSELGPDVRFMVCLREPVDRAFSAYLFMARQGRLRGEFAPNVREIDELLDHGRYDKHLEPFLDVFPRSSFYTPYFDDLRDDPDGFARDLFQFLGVEPLGLPPELQSEENAASKSRSFWVSKVARRAGVLLRDAGGEKVVAKVKTSPLLTRTLYTSFEASGGKPTLAPELAAELRDEMNKSVVRTDELLGTDCVGRWSYDATA